MINVFYLFVDTKIAQERKNVLDIHKSHDHFYVQM